MTQTTQDKQHKPWIQLNAPLVHIDLGRFDWSTFYFASFAMILLLSIVFYNNRPLYNGECDVNGYGEPFEQRMRTCNINGEIIAYPYHQSELAISTSYTREINPDKKE